LYLHKEEREGRKERKGRERGGERETAATAAE
jgi:hypothetical protein